MAQTKTRLASKICSRDLRRNVQLAQQADLTPPPTKEMGLRTVGRVHDHLRVNISQYHEDLLCLMSSARCPAGYRQSMHVRSDAVRARPAAGPADAGVELMGWRKAHMDCLLDSFSSDG